MLGSGEVVGFSTSATRYQADGMTDDPFEEWLEEGGAAETIETILEVIGSVPLWVWALLAIAAYQLINGYLSSTGRDRTPDPTGRREDRDGPSRDEYTIHDDLDADRSYEPPSESDPIETPNEVDRSILATIKRLARIGRSDSRD